MSDLELSPTSTIADGWTRQHEAYADGWWLKNYWDSTDGSHRDAIVSALESLGEFRSVLEVGCNTGPNLRRIHGRWPRVDLAGMDIHPGAIRFGRAQAAAEGWHWTGYVGDLRELGLLAEGTADVILSCYALAYLDPRDIDAALSACLRAARRAVILCEPMVLPGQDELFLGPSPTNVPEYWFDYQRRLVGLDDTHRGYSVVPIQPPHARLKYLLTVLK